MTSAEARAYSNGIDFYVQSKKMTIQARREKDGSISVRKTYDNPQIEKTRYRFLIVAGFTVIATLLWKLVEDAAMSYKIIAVLVLAWLTAFGYFFITSKISSNKSTFRYHAAEHKVLNYYMKHKSIPTTIEELAKEKSISFCCGSTVLTVVLLFATIVGLVLTFAPIWWVVLISVLVAAYVVLAMWANGYCDFLQKYALIEPSKNELEVALKGAEEYEKIKDR